MSSILRALKKLDDESTLRKSENKNQAGGLKIPANRRLRGQTGPSPLVNKFLLGLAIFLSLGIAGWLMIQSTGKTDIEKKQAVISQKPPTPIVPQVPINEPPLKTAAPISKDDQLPPQPTKVVEPIQAPPLLKEKNTTEPTGLILKGILWSPSAERRLALINDLYLKEGDLVKGITIVRIEKNEVILQSGTKTWAIGLKK